MNLNSLKWTKNVNRDDGKWAYSPQEINSNLIFCLHWKPQSRNNAQKPQEKDLVILRQKARVTHVVEFLNNEIYDGDGHNDWIYRLVKVIWIADVWSEPPLQTKVFGCKLNLQGGDVMELTNIKAISDTWKDATTIDFHQHIRQELENSLGMSNILSQK